VVVEVVVVVVVIVVVFVFVFSYASSQEETIAAQRLATNKKLSWMSGSGRHRQRGTALAMSLDWR